MPRRRPGTCSAGVFARAPLAGPAPRAYLPAARADVSAPLLALRAQSAAVQPPPGFFGGGASPGERRGRFRNRPKHAEHRIHPPRPYVYTYPEHLEKGPDPFDPAVRRRNLKTMLLVALGIAVLAAVPAGYRRLQQPEARYSTQAEAVSDGAVERGEVPRFVPATAARIISRRNRSTGQRFVRFDYAPAELPAIVSGMRQVPRAQMEHVNVPAPGWSKWWLITSRTLSGGQGEYLSLYEIPSGPDRGYLAVDPRTRHAYFWSR